MASFLSKIRDNICKFMGHKCPGKSHYDSRVEYFAFRLNGDAKIALVGDSITEGWELNQDIFSEKILNFGIAGDVSIGVLNRINQVINSKPEKVFVNIGTNDISFGFAPVLLDNINKIQSTLKNNLPNAKIFVCSIRYTIDSSKNILITSFNDGIKNIVDNFIDVNHVLAPEGVLKQEYTADGLHLSRLGYEAEYSVLKQYFS